MCANLMLSLEKGAGSLSQRRAWPTIPCNHQGLFPPPLTQLNLSPHSQPPPQEMSPN